MNESSIELLITINVYLASLQLTVVDNWSTVKTFVNEVLHLLLYFFYLFYIIR